MDRILKVVVGIVAIITLAQFIEPIMAGVIGLFAGLLWLIVGSWMKTRREQDLLNYGLTPEEMREVKNDLAAGNKADGLQRIQEAQDSKRALLQEEGIDPDSIVPLIGTDIKWKDIMRQVFRVLEFDRCGTRLLSDDTVLAATDNQPYGFLLVESPILNNRARLPVFHRDDFFLATTVYDEPELVDLVARDELLVTYFPERGFLGYSASAMHALHYVIVPQGTLEKYYEFNDDEHMAHPAPEKLFGEFVWRGEISVQIKADPDF